MNESDEHRLSQVLAVAIVLELLESASVELTMPIGLAEAVLNEELAVELEREVTAELVDEVKSTNVDVDWLEDVTMDIRFEVESDESWAEAEEAFNADEVALRVVVVCDIKIVVDVVDGFG